MQSQSPPFAHYSATVPVTETKKTNGETVEVTKNEARWFNVPLESSSIKAAFRYDPRKKGLLWYSTYHVSFDGKFKFRNPSDRQQNIAFSFPLPAEKAQYDDIGVTLDGRALELSHDKNSITAFAELPAGGEGELGVHYLSQGLDRWTYSFGDSVNQVRNFRLDAGTNFQDYDFASNSLSPTYAGTHRGGADLTWEYKDLVSGYPIVLIMPQKLQPGPLVERISFFAPVSLFFFFFVLFVLCTVRGIDLHPDALFLPGLHILLVPRVAGVSGRSHFDSRGIRDLLRRLNFSAGKLFAPRSESAIRIPSGGINPANLFGAVFLCLLLRRLHRPGHHDRRDLDALHSHANDRHSPLGRKVNGKNSVGEAVNLPPGVALGVGF